MKVVFVCATRWQAELAQQLGAQSVLVSYVHFLTDVGARRGLAPGNQFETVINNATPRRKLSGNRKKQRVLPSAGQE
jgi:hypothetical protein